MKKLVAALLVIACSGVLIFSLFASRERNKTDVVDVNEVARKHRSKTQDAGEKAGTDDVRPGEGTYIWQGSGYEKVDILGGSKHTYPKEIAGVVEHEGNGCKWSLELTFAKQHVERYSFCTDKAGSKVLINYQEISFFATTEKSDIRCNDDDAWRYKTPADTKPWEFTCEGNGRVIKQKGQFANQESMVVDGEEIDVQKLKIDSTFSGRAKGDETLEFVSDPTGLPIAFSTVTDITSESVLGDTDYYHKHEYRLKSLKTI